MAKRPKKPNFPFGKICKPRSFPIHIQIVNTYRSDLSGLNGGLGLSRGVEWISHPSFLPSAAAHSAHTDGF